MAAIIRWLGTLSDDIATHLQLPPVLASLRGILNAILDQQTSTATWAALIEVGEALENLIHGGHLVHHSDVLALDGGGHDTDLALPTQDEDRGGNEFIETLTALLKTVDSLPRGSLPAAQEAAMRLVRRVAARMPTAGDAAPDVGEETSWWHLDRHHGMGRLAYNSRKTLTDIPGEH